MLAKGGLCAPSCHMAVVAMPPALLKSGLQGRTQSGSLFGSRLSLQSAGPGTTPARPSRSSSAQPWPSAALSETIRVRACCLPSCLPIEALGKPLQTGRATLLCFSLLSSALPARHLLPPLPLPPMAGLGYYTSPFVGYIDCAEPGSGRHLGKVTLDTTVPRAGGMSGSCAQTAPLIVLLPRTGRLIAARKGRPVLGESAWRQLTQGAVLGRASPPRRAGGTPARHCQPPLVCVLTEPPRQPSRVPPLAVFVAASPDGSATNEPWGRFKITTDGELPPANYVVRYNTTGGVRTAWRGCTAASGGVGRSCGVGVTGTEP
jgi:hypothetical protein